MVTTPVIPGHSLTLTLTRWCTNNSEKGYELMKTLLGIALGFLALPAVLGLILGLAKVESYFELRTTDSAIGFSISLCLIMIAIAVAVRITSGE
jgi:hypothetical protein